MNAPFHLQVVGIKLTNPPRDIIQDSPVRREPVENTRLFYKLINFYNE